jgi:hypothetical protein
MANSLYGNEKGMLSQGLFGMPGLFCLLLDGGNLDDGWNSVVGQ